MSAFIAESIFEEMEEEYLEEDVRSDTETEELEEAHSEYIVIEEEGVGEAEYLDEADLDDDEKSNDELKEMLKGETEAFSYTPDVEYIYAEGVSENNEIIIGQVPRFTCKFCDASFKRLDSLYKHNSVHKGKTVCPVCRAVFSRVAHRTRHMRIKHPDVELIRPGKRGPRRKKEKMEEEEEEADEFGILASI